MPGGSGGGWHCSGLALSDAWPSTESQVSTGSTREVAVTPAVSTTTGLCSINSAPPQSNTRRADAELPRAAPLPHGRQQMESWRDAGQRAGGTVGGTAEGARKFAAASPLRRAGSYARWMRALQRQRERQALMQKSSGAVAQLDD